MEQRLKAPSEFSVVRGAVLLGLALVIGVVLVVVLALQAYTQFDRSAREGRAIRDAQQGLGDVLELHLDQETGLRGYVETGQQSYLEPYTRGRREFAERLVTLEQSAGMVHSSSLPAMIAEIGRLHAVWQREVATPLLARPLRPDSLALQRNGKGLTDRLRAQVRDARTVLRDRQQLVQQGTWRFINEGLFTGIVLVAVIALAGIAFVFWRANVQTRLARGRAVVNTLQRAFLSDLHDLPGMRIGSVYSSASRDAAVGGDFYDAVQLDQGRVMVLIGDISGKGTEAAVNTAFAKYSVRTLAYEGRDPARILNAFNGVFLDSIRDPSLFVALFVAIVDLEALRVTYASAGLAGAFLRRNGDVKQLEVTGPVVGLDRGLDFENRTIDVEPTDQLVLVTDGLTEARDRTGAMLGSSGVIDLVCKAPSDPQACADALSRAARKRTRGALSDDLAILVIGFDGPSSGAA
jgi:CHASE3 domain sensor protein